MHFGFLPGFINGLLGTGGGILAVNRLKKQGCSPNEAQATAIGLMLPLSGLSLFFSSMGQNCFFLAYWPLLFSAIGGAWIGSTLLKHIPAFTLQLLFSLLILYSGMHLLLE